MTSAGWADQIAAAKRETAQTYGVLAGAMPTAANMRPGKVLDQVRKWQQSFPPRLGCQHMAAPTMALGLLAAPGVAYCAACGAAACDEQVKANPDRCDTCGGSSARFHELVIPAASVLLLFGNVCPDCMAVATGVGP